MSLEGEYDYDNIFVKILKGDMPSVKVFEDDHVLAFMDVFPQSEGHTLVIPKAPSRNLFDTNPAELAFLVQQVQMVTKAVKQALTPDGVRIMQLNGTPAGQTVFHLHFHIIPVYQGGETRAHASGGMADMAELETIAAKIRSALNKDNNNA